MKLTARYKRHLPKDEKWETPEIVAAVQFIDAVDAGWLPAPETIAVIRSALQRMVAGESPDSVWKRGKGKPTDSGINPSIVVSAYIEIMRRGSTVEDSLASAKEMAISAFGITGDPDGARRQVNRHWKAGQATACALGTVELCEIIKPYEVQDSDASI